MEVVVGERDGEIMLLVPLPLLLLLLLVGVLAGEWGNGLPIVQGKKFRR